MALPYINLNETIVLRRGPKLNDTVILYDSNRIEVYNSSAIISLALARYIFSPATGW